MKKNKEWPFLLSPILFIILLYGPTLTKIGFLSDDWDLLERVSKAPFYLPIEHHHYNLFINFLFKLVAVDLLSPLGIHLIAIIGHIANTFLVFLIVRNGFHMDRTFASMVSLLFALSPAGVEAVVWCCAIGYVATAFWIFLAIYLFTQQNKYASFWFAVVQLLAFASWDWGMLVFPCLLVMACFYQTQRSRKEGFISLIPVAACWVTILLLKKIFGFSLGYSVNSPLVFLKNILSSPFVILFPQFSKSFYQSAIGIALTFTFLVTLIIYSYRHRTALVMLLLFFVCQLPQAVLGYPQSRYAYLAVFPLCFLLLYRIMLFQVFFQRARILVPFFVLAAIYFIWTSERVALWQEGFSRMEQIYSEVQQLAEEKAVVVVNPPDRYGPEELIWLPQGLRNGRNRFSRDVIFYTTPDSPLAFKISGLPELTREEIKQKHPGAILYEP